jgi:hypothetical protein
MVQERHVSILDRLHHLALALVNGIVLFGRTLVDPHLVPVVGSDVADTPQQQRHNRMGRVGG